MLSAKRTNMRMMRQSDIAICESVFKPRLRPVTTESVAQRVMTAQSMHMNALSVTSVSVPWYCLSMYLRPIAS